MDELDQVAALRALAALCRRAASIPTTGGHRADRVLLDLADRLEREYLNLETDYLRSPLATPAAAARVIIWEGS